MLNQDIWGIICAPFLWDVKKRWDVTENNVACRQLGFPGGADKNFFSGGVSHNGRQIWLRNVKCKGTEADLSLCSHDEWGEHPSKEGWPAEAGVFCQKGEAIVEITITIVEITM